VESEKKPAADASKEKKKKPAGILGRLKKVKHIELYIAGIAVVVMLAIYFGSQPFAQGASVSGSSPAKNTQQAAASAKEDYCARMERELAETLSKMDGAGETRVIINWESGVEAVIAYITNASQNGTSASPQVITGGGSQSPIVLKEIYPKAVGVVVMTQGGAVVKVKLDIINAVSVLLDIKPDKIQVLTMSKSKN